MSDIDDLDLIVGITVSVICLSVFFWAGYMETRR